MIDFLLNLWASIENLVYWFPVIWHDRNWGYQFIFKMLRHKLIGVKQSLRQSQLMDGNKEADNVRLAILLLDRILAENYHDITFMSHKRAKHAEYLHNQDIEYLFNHMTKYIRQWWN